ncbi:MAG: hypothetical protein ABEL76_15305, partial [Bradymonadaceae bacterium]
MFGGEERCRIVCDTAADCPAPDRYRCLRSVCVQKRDGPDVGPRVDAGRSDTGVGSDTGRTDAGDGLDCSIAGDGELGCTAALVCTASCAEDDGACRRRTVRQTEKKACETFDSYRSCVADKCANADDRQECTERNCAKKEQACVTSPPEGRKPLDCGATLLCVSDCRGDGNRSSDQTEGGAFV